MCAEPRLRAHKRCPRKSPRTRHKLRHKFLEVCETLRTRMLQVCGHVCGHVCGQNLRTHLRTHLRTSAARAACGWCVCVCVKGICGRNWWLSTGHASQCKPTQWKYWLVSLLLMPHLGKETEQGTCKRHRQRPPPPNHERMLYLMAEQ